MDFIFYLTLFLFILLFGSAVNYIDYDFFARLIVGKSFFQTGEIFRNDFYSWGTTHEFIDHEWGSSLIFYLIQNHFGDIGLYVFKSILIFATFYIMIKTIKLQKNKVELHFLFFFFLIQSISYNIFSTIRCQSFSFFFFAIFFYILTYCKLKKNYRVLLCLPILNIIWLNMHGGFVLGIALISIFAIGEYLNKNKEYSKYLFITLIAMTLTCFINPYGIKYIYFIFDAFTLNRVHITEWQSAFFDKHGYYPFVKFKMFFFIAQILFLFSIVKNIKLEGTKNFFLKIDKTKYLILIFMTLICLKALRCHVFFSYSVLILCYNDFYNIFNKKLPHIIDNIKEILLCILILISTISHIYNYKFINVLYANEYPIYAVEFIKQNNLKGNIFTMFHTGSYVAYKLYPNNLVFMDGRYEEVYDTNLINEMGDVFLAKNYKNFFDKYSTDILITDNSYPIKKALDNDKDFCLVHKDKYFSVHLTKTCKNQKFRPPRKDIEYYYKTKFLTSIDWLK